MRKKQHANRRRGQFAVISALVIAGFTLSLVLSISQVGLNRQTLDYKPVQETILSITSDFERCLANALAAATKTYSETGNKTLSEEAGEKVIEGWINAMLATHGELGLEMRLQVKGKGPRSVSLELEWGEMQGLSQGLSSIFATLTVSAPGYGLNDLALLLTKSVQLRIPDGMSKITIEGATHLVDILFVVGEARSGVTAPIAGITLSDLTVKVDETPITQGMKLEYLGGGAYRLSFNVNESFSSVTLIVSTPGDRILVGAKLKTCLVTLLSNDTSKVGIVNEGTFMVNGTSYNPPSSLCLLPGNVVNVGFNAPEGGSFISFSTSGPLQPLVGLEENPNTFQATGYGSASITALYNSSKLNYGECYINFRSRDENGAQQDQGIITINGVNHSLPVLGYKAEYNGILELKYTPNLGYEFYYWYLTIHDGTVIVTNPSSAATNLKVCGSATVTAVYRPSRDADWQYLYLNVTGSRFTISPGIGGKEKEIQPISHGHPSESGTSSTTPSKYLNLGDISIRMYARASSKDVVLKITLGFYTPSGSLMTIFTSTFNVKKDNNYSLYSQTVQPQVNVIPPGSVLVLIFERGSTDPGGGTLHVLAGSDGFRIQLWQ